MTDARPSMLFEDRKRIAEFSVNTVSVIDTATDRVVSTIDVGPNPHGLAVSRHLAALCRCHQQLGAEFGVGRHNLDSTQRNV